MWWLEFGDIGSPLSSTPVSVADVVVASAAAASLLLTGSVSISNTAAAVARLSMTAKHLSRRREVGFGCAWDSFYGLPRLKHSLMGKSGAAGDLGTPLLGVEGRTTLRRLAKAHFYALNSLRKP